MKKTTLLLLLVGLTGIAQIKGNKKIETRTFPAKGLTNLEIALYAKVEIDQLADEEITITTDSNLFDLIDKEIVDGKLLLTQKEWIQASQDILIKIGMPAIKRVQLNVHERVVLKNIKKDNISVMALNGTIEISGEVNSTGIGAENGTIDASKLQSKEVYLNIWGRGKAIVNATELLESTLSNDARIEVIGTPEVLKGDTKKTIAKSNKPIDKSLKWIHFKIKNNSANRNQFAVVGPKPDGSKFGYGFPMMPYASKKERWTVGTKVYKVNKLGLKKLLLTINIEDEGKTLKLFQ